jgi:subtilisin family serine protease
LNREGQTFLTQMTRLLTLAAIAAVLAAGPARAQLGGLGLPHLPSTPGIGDVTGRLGSVGEQTPLNQTAAELSELRRTTINQLLARHRDVLEADAHGDPIVRGEVLAIAPTEPTLAAARALGFSILRTDAIDGLGAMVTLKAPANMTTPAALDALRRADPAGVFDFDHLNLPSGSAVAATAAAGAAGPAKASGPRIGLIDGGVAHHPSLRGAVAEQRGFNGEAAVPSAHATAIASLLVGRGHGVSGAAPDGALYVADIYGGQPTGGTSAALARALGWLTSAGVPVINISLVGPRNQVVEAVVESVVRRGFVIVAAVGNDGPAAAPLYPAAYAGVVGVTGVDARGRALVEAERGPQVMFAAAGIANAAAGENGVASVRGTSFAAPIVAGLIAERMRAPGDGAAALSALQNEARDLGAPGRDEVYGYGLLTASQRLAGSR